MFCVFTDICEMLGKSLCLESLCVGRVKKPFELNQSSNEIDLNKTIKTHRMAHNSAQNLCLNRR